MGYTLTQISTAAVKKGNAESVPLILIRYIATTTSYQQIYHNKIDLTNIDKLYFIVQTGSGGTDTYLQFDYDGTTSDEVLAQSLWHFDKQDVSSYTGEVEFKLRVKNITAPGTIAELTVWGCKT